MRWSISAACALLVGLVVGGCYSPHVTSGGFACVPTDDPPCPKGYYCVNGLCVDDPAQMVGGDDLAIGGDMSLPVGDFSSGPDLAQSRDLAGVTGDMAGGSCAASGNQCITQTCCAGLSCLFICF